METKRLALIALVSSLALVLAFAYAHVMSYYPVNVTLVPSAPKVIFAPGSNAGGTDIDGSNIEVTIGANATSLTITVHPTYETTYYQNITLIKNTDTTTAYNVNIVVDQGIDLTKLPAGSKAYLIIYNLGATRQLTGWPVPMPNTGTYVNIVDLTQSGETTPIGQLSAGGVWEVDLLVYIPEGAPASTVSATLYLTASPS